MKPDQDVDLTPFDGLYPQVRIWDGPGAGQIARVFMLAKHTIHIDQRWGPFEADDFLLALEPPSALSLDHRRETAV